MAVSLVTAEVFLLAVSAISILFGIINIIAVNKVDMEEIKASGSEFDENQELLDENDDANEDRIDSRRRETVDQK